MRTDWTRYFRIGLSQCKRGDDAATVAAAATFERVADGRLHIAIPF